MWSITWTKKDFEIAFKKSPLGWKYQWEKSQGYLNNNSTKESAVLRTILNMDDKHQGLLLDFLLSRNKNILKNHLKEFDNYSPMGELNTTSMHHIYLWAFNWTEDDFRQAFNHSPTGWQIIYNRMKNYQKETNCGTKSVLKTVLELNSIDIELLTNFIINERYKEAIKRSLQHKEFMKNWNPNQN
jgi:hypothetical protein